MTTKTDRKVYWRGRIATLWYNTSELIAYMFTYRRTPKTMVYEKRVPYGEGKQQYYNAFCRKDLADKEKPLMVYIHGGGFISGITDMRNTYVKNFAERGFYAASVSYTYAPKKVFPEPLQEVCSAIDEVVDRAEERKINVKNVLLAAESAGVYFMFMLAALATEPGLADKLGIRFRHVHDIEIKGMISHSGCIDLKSLLDEEKPQSKFPDIRMMTCSFLGKTYEEAWEYLNSPDGENVSAKINEKFPPTFFATGANDWLRYESYDAMKTYDKYKIPYAKYEGTGAFAAHAWTIATVLKKGKECLNQTFAFFAPYFPI